MIAYIKGTLAEIDEQAVYVEAGGIGYEVICANPFQFQDQIGESVKIFTYHYFREDFQALYGFKKVENKQLFAKLLNVSGIGPKGALAVLATVRVQDFVTAIEQEDEKFLTGFPGVGKKTARQMILDLKGKLPFTLEPVGGAVGSSAPQTASHSQALEEAIDALRALGYAEREITAILPALKQEDYENADAYVRKGLALMMSK
ncbi:Holliday junction branch migration protein RuvA [Radiobacillus sp. PE A8.2]|uniref:Holliday junction branch migration protein RuvA n=1 Tax=Radiobacillus sp. PE A8.2 TaxID=3380349 RepID=UPI00388EDD48